MEPKSISSFCIICGALIIGAHHPVHARFDACSEVCASEWDTLSQAERDDLIRKEEEMYR
jgi:hypothetical protein